MKSSILSPLGLRKTLVQVSALMGYTKNFLASLAVLKEASLPHAALGLVVFSVFAFPQHSSGQSVSPQAIEETPGALQELSEEEIKELLGLSSLVGGSMTRAILSPQKPPKPTQQMWVVMTAYSSTPDQTDSTPFITASGTHVHDGIVAANFVRLGTKVRIPDIYGNKIFVVEDRMNKRYRYRMDIWMETRAQAKHFGLRNVKVEILQD